MPVMKVKSITTMSCVNTIMMFSVDMSKWTVKQIRKVKFSYPPPPEKKVPEICNETKVLISHKKIVFV